MNQLPSEALIICLDGELAEEELVEAVRHHAARVGPFRLVLEINDALEVTSEMALGWLSLLGAPDAALTAFLVVSAAVPPQVMTHALALVARRQGLGVPVEAFPSVAQALAWTPPAAAELSRAA
jgi:hypothetical protein